MFLSSESRLNMFSYYAHPSGQMHFNLNAIYLKNFKPALLMDWNSIR